MAGTMVHLVIADKLCRKWGDAVLNTPYGDIQLEKDYFIAGNICPDGIMARKNYVRAMKKHTHFRDGIDDSVFTKHENVKLFRQRLDAFMKKSFAMIEKDDNMTKSLYYGYYIHMLTDEKFMFEIRPEFMKNIAVLGLTQNDMETFKYFGRDVDCIDFRLIKEYGGINSIYNALKSIRPYEIVGMITEEELTDSRNWILEYFFEKEHDIKSPKYISYERLVEFIEDVVKLINDFLVNEK